MSFITAILSLVALQALTATALPPCTCTRNLREVCGSDGKTYANECILNCEKHNTGADLTVARDGPCDIVKDSCICTYEYKPVCGNDGQTYPNRCSLLCARSVNPDVDVVSEGACDTAKVTEVPCICPDVLKQVCGTDGNTYDNSCVLNCATAKYSTLGIKHQGKCDDSVRVAEPMLGDQPNCTCPRDLKPVCGSDGTTYANKCLLECAGAQVTIARQGSCSS